MEGSALLSAPSVSSPECHGEYPCPKAAAPLALRAGNLGHCHSWSRGAYAPRKGPPGCAGWGRRVSRGLRCSGSGLGPGGPLQRGDANGPPGGRAHWRATDRRGRWERPGWRTPRGAGSGRGAPLHHRPRVRATGSRRPHASASLEERTEALGEWPLHITALKIHAGAIFCPWKSWGRGGNRGLALRLNFGLTLGSPVPLRRGKVMG